MRLPEGSETGERIRASARRALAESRHAIHALSATGNRSLEEGIADAAAHSAGRTQVVGEHDLKAGPPLRLQISDDGRGFDPSVPAGRGGFGLASMAQRARDVGADLQIRSVPGGGGTTVEVTL
jgi:signal transduction histidine kinase